MNCADAARGQRTDYTSSKNKDGTLTVTDDVKKVNLFVKMKNDYPTIRVAVKDANVYCADALGGTGLKGVLVDRAESVAFQSSATNDFTGKEVISLFQENGVRYSTLEFTTDLEGVNNAKIVLPVVNKVLAGLGTSIPNNAIELKYTKLSKLNIIGKKGYCNYRCSGVNSSIRYNIAFYLEFLNFDKTGEDASRTITVNTPLTVQLLLTLQTSSFMKEFVNIQL